MARQLIGLLLVVGMVALTVRIAFGGGGATTQAGDITLGAGTATLVRNDNGVSMTLELTGVVAGHVYSAWWFVGANPPVNAAGAIANGGRAMFAGHLSEGGILADARADDIIVRVLYHGPKIPGQIHQQMTTTFTGAPPSSCNGTPGSCGPPVAVIEFDAP